MKSLFIFCILFAGILWSSVAQSDTTASKYPLKRLGIDNVLEKKYIEKTQVVSASRSSKTIEDLPVTIYVVSGEDIRRNGYTTLVDVLKSVPGIRTSKLFSGMLGEGFLMRGLIGNSYCKILIDNIPTQPVVMGSLPIGSQLPIAQAEQIEIVFGPAAAVYGADAMAGIINIITRKSKESEVVSINYTKGQQGFNHLDLFAGGKVGRNKNVISYTIFGNHTKRTDENFSRSKEIFNNVRDFKRYFNLENQIQELLKYKDLSFSILKQTLPHYKGSFVYPEISTISSNSSLVGASFKYRNLTFAFQDMYRQNHSSIGLIPLIYSYHNPNSYIGENIQRTTVSYSNQFKRFGVQANLSYLRYRMGKGSNYASTYASESNGESYIYSASDDFFGEGILNYQISNHAEITAGASLVNASSLPIINERATPFNLSDYRPFDIRYRPDPHPVFAYFGYNPTLRRSVGVFIQLFLTWRKWTTILGSRYDKTLGFRPRNYSRFSALYKLSPKSAFRLSWAGAIRAPTPNEQYMSAAFNLNAIQEGAVFYAAIPNPDLNPEALGNLELGFQKRFSKKWNMETILLAQSISQLITPIRIDLKKTEYATQGGGDQQVYKNYNDKKSQSVLLELQMLLHGENIIPAIKMNVDLWAKFAVGESHLPKTGKRLLNAVMVPHRMLQFNVSACPTKKLYFRMESQWLSGWLNRHSHLLEQREQEIHEEHGILRNEGYFNLDLMVNYKLNKNLNIYLRSTNLLNQSYAGLNPTGRNTDMSYNPQQLRNVYLGLRFHLN